jgi:hypothetical protein
MTTQLLFYENAVPLSASRHADVAIEPPTFAFCRNVNAVPLTAVEFQTVAEELAIVFAGQPGDLVPMAVLGVRPGENLFVDADGTWDARYIPGFIRRYPFVFTTPDGGDTYTLCVDEVYSGLNREGRGRALYDADRKPSAFTNSVLEFLREYQMEVERTRKFCRRLEDLGLMQAMQVEVGTDGGKPATLGGFFGVDREKLRALPPEALAGLARDDALEMVYVHLQSLRNIARLRPRLEARQAAEKG